MPILENATDYAEDGQVTHTNLNALTESAKFVKAGTGVTNTGNATDETSANINASGEIEVKDGGVTTAKLGADAVTGDKIADDTIDSEHYAAASVDNEHLQGSAVSGSGAHSGNTSNVQLASIGAADFAVDAVSGQTVYPAGDLPGDTDSVTAFDASASTLAELTLLKMSQYLPFPKAFGVVTLTTTTAALESNSYNLQNPTEPSTTQRKLEFINDLSDGNYTVMITVENPAGAAVGEPPQVVETNAGDFTIELEDGESTNRKLHIAIFGAQAAYSA